jgi:hypothetical protein
LLEQDPFHKNRCTLLLSILWPPWSGSPRKRSQAGFGVAGLDDGLSCRFDQEM